MKRLFASVIFLVICALGLYAETEEVGFGYGGAFGFMWGTSTIGPEGERDELKNPYWYFESQIDAVNYAWYADNGLGIDCGLTFIVPGFYREFGRTFRPANEFFHYVAKPHLGFRYRGTINSWLAIEAGLGAYIKFGAKEYRGFAFDSFEVGGEIDAALRFAVREDIGIKAGVKVSAPIWSSVYQKDAESGTAGGHLTQYGFTAVPFVGAVFVI